MRARPVAGDRLSAGGDRRKRADLLPEGADQLSLVPGLAEEVTHEPGAQRGLEPFVEDAAREDDHWRARQQRLAEELARVVMEQLFASTPDLGTLAHG